MHTEWSRAGEPLDKGNTINGINHLAKATNILWKNTHRGLQCVPKRKGGIWEEKLASRSGWGWETHSTRRNFLFSFGQRKKKIIYLSSFLKTAGVGLGDLPSVVTQQDICSPANSSLRYSVFSSVLSGVGTAYLWSWELSPNSYTCVLFWTHFFSPPSAPV